MPSSANRALSPYLGWLHTLLKFTSFNRRRQLEENPANISTFPRTIPGDLRREGERWPPGRVELFKDGIDFPNLTGKKNRRRCYLILPGPGRGPGWMLAFNAVELVPEKRNRFYEHAEKRATTTTTGQRRNSFPRRLCAIAKFYDATARVRRSRAKVNEFFRSPEKFQAEIDQSDCTEGIITLG